MASIGRNWNRCEVAGCRARRPVSSHYCKAHRDLFGEATAADLGAKVLASRNEYLAARAASKTAYYRVGYEGVEAARKAEDLALARHATACAHYRVVSGEPPLAFVADDFDGDTVTWGLYVDGKIDHWCWSTNEAREWVEKNGARWIDEAPALSHLER